MPKNKPIGKIAAGVEPGLLPEAILAGLEEAVIAVDHHRSVVYANGAADLYLASDSDGDNTAAWRELLLKNQWLDAALEVSIAEGRSYVRHETSLLYRGEPRTVSVSLTPLFSEDGGRLGAVCLLSDQASLATMSESLRRADRLRQLGVLAAGLAHEIKNPLGGILGAAQLLRGDLERGEGIEYLDLIERDVRRINRLLEQLLDFGNPAPLTIESVNIHQLVDEVVQGLQHDPATGHYEVQRDYDPSLPDVPADADALRQILVNLVKNAFEASPPGHSVVIRSRVELGGRRIAARRAVLIEIQNAGPELSAEVRDRLFTPFFTTKSTGTGLGLAISLRLLREHGGTLEVASEPGRTTFTIILPMERSASAENAGKET
jgi:two-component system, NtrC family, nitrogen regulation sensor histidine kinase GlnL